MQRRLWPLILIVGLISSLVAGIGAAAEEEEEGGNNLSTPVIFAEGYGLSGVMVDPADYTTTGFPGLAKCGGVEDWSGTAGEAPYAITFDAQGTDPTEYQLEIDGQPYLTPLAGTSTAPEGDYYLQPYTLDGDLFGMETCWEADWVDGSGLGPVDINALDVGDDLVRVLRTEGNSPVRVEFSLYQSTETPGTFQGGTLLEGYPMTALWPPAFEDGKPPSVGSGERQEVWATASESATSSTPADLATVYTHNARLTVDRLTWTGLPDSFADGDLDGYPTGVIPDTFERNYDKWVASVEYDGVVGGSEGESGFSAEVNQGGRALYGYNWGMSTSGVETGWYRITLSIDGDVSGVADNATITGIDPADQLADESDGGSSSGGKGFFPPTLVEDAKNGNYLYLDVYIAPEEDHGSGKMAGKVTTDGSTALAGKIVTLFDATGAPAATDATDAQGQFEVSVIPGTYKVGVVDPLGVYESEFYKNRPVLGEADEVVVLDGQTTIVTMDLDEPADDPPGDDTPGDDTPGDDTPGEPADAPSGGHFRDVDDGNIFYASIEWMYQAGITKGCNPPANDRFCPEQQVTRAQIASFFVRALGLTEGSTDDRFDDDDDSVHEADINRLATAGITKGCNPPANDRFCPEQQVTRAQIASFFVRALGLTEGSTDDRFDDDDDSVHEADINRLATAGITKGCNPPANDRFCPGVNIPREQIAAFFHRALD